MGNAGGVVAQQPSPMGKTAQPVTCTDPFLACCLCRRLLLDAVQLTCLHSCCQCCFSTAASTDKSGDVTCGMCGEVTHAGAQQPNAFIDQQVECYRAINEFKLCGACKKSDELKKPALVWCPACKHSLCEDCLPAHGQYTTEHVTQSLKELTSLDGVCPQSYAAACCAHKRPLEIACLNCEQAKCSSCWADCKKNNHKMYMAGDESFENYVNKFVVLISSDESALLQKAGVLEKPTRLMTDLKAARADHLEQINQRKRCIMDAVDVAYQQIEGLTNNIYDDMEKEAGDASIVAERINMTVSNARNYIRRLLEANSKCLILNQQRTVRERLKVLSAEIDAVRISLDAIPCVNIHSALPADFEMIVKAWIGTPLMRKGKHWVPLNSAGQLYDRRLQISQHAKKLPERPEGIPQLSDVVLDKSFDAVVVPEPGSRAIGRLVSGRDYDFTPGYVKAGPAPRGPRAGSSKNDRDHWGGGWRPRESPDAWPQRKVNEKSLEKVQLHRSCCAYRPLHMKGEVKLTKSEAISRQFTSILNKLTPQNFERLVSSVLALPIDTEESLRCVIYLTFEKAVREPSYSVAYANMCKSISSIKVATDKPGEVVDFRKLLLTRCQREFEKDLTDEEDSKAKLEALQKAENETIKIGLQKEYDLFVFKARRRSLGNIRFIGELFKQKMLTEAIMHDCIVKLLKNNEEDSLECLCALLKTIGKDIDHEKAKPRNDQYFNQMKKITSQKKISSRVRFKLQYIIDLRENNWVPRFADNNPKTIAQIHREAAMAARERSAMIPQDSGCDGLSWRERASVELKKIAARKKISPQARLKLQDTLNLRETNSTPTSRTVSAGDNQLLPPIMWAQRKDMLFLTINLEDCKEPVIELKPEYLNFSGVGGKQKLLHAVKVDFYADVDLEHFRHEVQPRYITLTIRKKEQAPYWPRLTKQAAKVHWLKTDFSKWKDEDDSDDDIKDGEIVDKTRCMIRYTQISPLDTTAVKGRKRRWRR